MSKILKALKYQLKTEFKDGVKNVRIIYDYLSEKHQGHIWESNQNPLVKTNFVGTFPYSKKVYSLTDIGKMVLNQLTDEANI